MPRPASEPATCFGCQHFRITHDPGWPYACTHFDLRARRLPSVVVEQDSGEPCAAREPRGGEPPGEPLPAGSG